MTAIDDFWQENLERNQSDKRYWRRRDNVLRCLKELSVGDARILNIGCGIGAASHFIEQEFHNAAPVSLDMSSNSLIVGKNYYNLRYPVMANALYLPFNNETFEIVLMMEVIEHIREQDRLLSEATRVLKKGGNLIITTSPIKSDILYSFTYWIKRKELFGFSVRRASVEHVAEQHPSELKCNLEKHGLKVRKMKYWNGLHLISIPPLMKIPLLSSLIVGVDDKLGVLNRLCTDIVCVAQKGLYK